MSRDCLVARVAVARGGAVDRGVRGGGRVDGLDVGRLGHVAGLVRWLVGRLVRVVRGLDGRRGVGDDGRLVRSGRLVGWLVRGGVGGRLVRGGRVGGRLGGVDVVVLGLALVVDVGVETVLVGDVAHGLDAAVGQQRLVLALGVVAVAVLDVAVVVARVLVLDVVRVVVLRVLKGIINNIALYNRFSF